MLKYVNTEVTFAEVPDEITLCINISNCHCHCKGCHSAYLADDIGKPLDWGSLNALIYINTGITCVAFMGGDADPKTVNKLAEYVKKYHGGLKIAWYSGRQEIHPDIKVENFDFIKVGPYMKDKGPLTSTTTNQVFYKVVRLSGGKCKLFDITYKFWNLND